MTAGGLVMPTNDPGDVNFAVDLQAGVIRVGVRPPLGLESARVVATVSVLTFLDQAAGLTLAMNEAQRRAMAQLGIPT